MKQLKDFLADVRDFNRATSVDIIIDNKTEIKGPLTINIHLAKNQELIKVILDNKNPSSPNAQKFGPVAKKILVVVVLLVVTFLILVLSTSKIFPRSETKSTFQIISREEWKARTPVDSAENLNLPVHRVIIAHTATALCNIQEACSKHLQNIQNFHIDSRSLSDIQYNFLIGGDGNIYEGRGWNARGAHTIGFNDDSLGIAFIGTFSTIKPSAIQLEAAKRILDEGVRINKLVENYRLYGARQLIGTESPGRALYEIIREWPNWSNTTSK